MVFGQIEPNLFNIYKTLFVTFFVNLANVFVSSKYNFPF